MGAESATSWLGALGALAAERPVTTAIVLLLALYLAREAVGVLIDSVFVQAARILEDFAAETRKLARAVLEDAKATLYQMQREEFADNVSSRQKELMSVLERFQTVEERHKKLTETVRKGAEKSSAGGASQRALMTLSAELAAADDRFSKNIEYIKANESALNAIHDEQVYTFSPFIRFIFAALFMTLIMFGGVTNFALIVRPLTSLFGDVGYTFGGVDIPYVASATIIVIEAVVGFFFLESLRMTKVLPTFHDLSPGTRAIWAGSFFFILVCMSIMEGSLAIWREQLIDLELEVEAAGGEQTLAGPIGLVAHAPVVFQVMLGMLMPFILALIAIPLETFLKNARVVMMFLLAGGLALAALPLSVLSVLIGFAGDVTAAVFNVVTSVPNAIARLFVRGWMIVRRARGRTA